MHPPDGALGCMRGEPCSVEAGRTLWTGVGQVERQLCRKALGPGPGLPPHGLGKHRSFMQGWTLAMLGTNAHPEFSCFTVGGGVERWPAGDEEGGMGV